MTNRKTVLEIKGLTKTFGGIRAVSDVSLKIYEGDIYCLIGPNGAGKSTIFKMIMGEYPPTAGKIIYFGKDITREKQWMRAHKGISIKMQIPGVFKELTVRDNIRIALLNHVKGKDIDKDIEKLLDLVKIGSLGDQLVKNLSHGQQQWTEMAMAMASDPKLLLLDEPVAGMGPEETERTADLVKEINKMGITILFIDHDMDFVRRIAEQVTVLHYGKIFAEGTMGEIENNEGVRQIYLGNS